MKIKLNKGYFAEIDDDDSWVANVNERWRASLGLGKMKPYVDHIDGNGLNCRRENLRIVDQECNTRNVFKARKTNIHSPYLGVGLRNGRWRARIYHNGKLIQIGMFSCIEAANRARLEVERDLCGVQPRREQAFIDAGVLF